MNGLELYVECNLSELVAYSSVRREFARDVSTLVGENRLAAFISYATSKAALGGLTQSLAVDCGEDIRVNMIEPAAIATPMLLEGFVDNPEAREGLEEYHPVGRLGLPVEVAELVRTWFRMLRRS